MAHSPDLLLMEELSALDGTGAANEIENLQYTTCILLDAELFHGGEI